MNGGKEEDRLRGGGGRRPSTPLFPPLSTHMHTLSHPSPLPTLRAPLLATGHGGLQGGQLVGQAAAAGGARHVVDREERRRARRRARWVGWRASADEALSPRREGERGGECFFFCFRATDLAVSTPPSQLFPPPSPLPHFVSWFPHSHTHHGVLSLCRRLPRGWRVGQGEGGEGRALRRPRCVPPPPFNPLTRRPWPRQA